MDKNPQTKFTKLIKSYRMDKLCGSACHSLLPYKEQISKKQGASQKNRWLKPRQLHTNISSV